MNEIELLLAEKESALQQVKRQIEALRRSAALLAEPDGMKAAATHTPAIVAATAEPALPLADVLGFAREGASQAKSNVPNYVRFSSGANVFPPANEGVIVCDGCGHRNPDFLLDCERCDLPIRLRP